MWLELAVKSALELARFVNKPEAEGWAKEILALKEEKRVEEKKPSFEDRDIYPNLRAKDFRNDARVTDIDDSLFNLSEAITTAARGNN